MFLPVGPLFCIVQVHMDAHVLAWERHDLPTVGGGRAPANIAMAKKGSEEDHCDQANMDVDFVGFASFFYEKGNAFNAFVRYNEFITDSKHNLFVYKKTQQGTFMVSTEKHSPFSRCMWKEPSSVKLCTCTILHSKAQTRRKTHWHWHNMTVELIQNKWYPRFLGPPVLCSPQVKQANKPHMNPTFSNKLVY